MTSPRYDNSSAHSGASAAQPSMPAGSPEVVNTSHRPMIPIAAFIFLALAIFVFSAFLFDRLESSTLNAINGQMEAVGHLKSKQINEWFQERKRDVEIFTGNPLFVERVDRWVQDGNQEDEQRIRQWFISLRKAYHYKGIHLIDSEGKVRMAIGSPSEFAPPDLDLVAKAVASRSAFFSDFHLEGIGPMHPEIDMAAPLQDTARGVKPAAIIYVSMDPALELYPLILSWPAPSRSAETLLVRQEGKDILYLNELRHRKGTALKLRLPASSNNLLAAQAVKGEKGIIRSRDYRGVPCIAFLSSVPTTSWYIVSKIDEAEVLAPLRRQQRLVSGIVILLIATSGGIVFLWWRQQKSNFTASYYKSELKRRSLAVRFDDLYRNANDIVLLFDEDGNIIDANNRAIEKYGYSRERLFGLSIRDLRAPETMGALEADWSKSADVTGTIFETVHLRCDGARMAVEVSARTIKVGDICYRQSIIRDITERKKAEHALRDALARTVQFFEQPLTGMAIISSEKRWLEVNDKLCEILGYDREELTKKTWKDVTHPEDFFAISTSFERTLAGEISGYEMDARFIRQDGETIWASIATRCIRRSDGSADYFVASLKDITAIKRAEEALRASRDKFASLFSASPVPFLAVDLDGIVMAWNEAATQVFGWSEPEVIGKFLPFVPEENRSQSLKFLQGVNQGLSLTRMEVVRRTKSDSAIDISLSLGPLRSADGSIYGAIAVMEEITQRKLIERTLLENEQRYRLLSEQFHALLDALPDSIFLINHENRVLWASATAVDASDRKPGAFEGEHCFNARHGRSTACNPCPTKKAFVSGRQESGSVRTVDGKILELRAVPMLNADGKVENVIEIARDVTEQMQVEEHLRHAQKMDAVGTLAGGIAHDFNNILSVIMGYATFLKMKMSDDDPLRHNIMHILSASERAAALTRGLLTYSRKAPAAEMETTDLNEIVRKADLFLSRTIGEEIMISQSLAPNPLPVLADDGQIEQVLMNLAINARDSMPEGGDMIIQTDEVVIDDAFIAAHGFGTTGRFAVLSVSDTGTGMEKETVDRIFEPFFTTKDVGKGTGLGLSIVFGIVKRHDGFINVYSELGCGTTFRVYLPLTDESRASEVKALDEKIPGGTERILVIEDSDQIRDFLTELLMSVGYQVIQAANGEEAVRIFTEQREPVELLLLDVIMPRKNGKETYEEIRSLDRNVKAIFMSGYTSDVITSKGLDADGLFFVQKPIRPISLLAKIREALDSKMILKQIP